MKRIVLAVTAVALVAAAMAAWSGAVPLATSGADAPSQAKPKAKLPPLPANIKARGRWNIGVKCDVPPFGYINVKGQNAGFDVEIARWFARYAFGKASRVNFTCAPTPAREPLLTTDRVDLVISTFTYTQDRDTRIDFSRAYYKAAGRLLVPNNGPVQKLSDINGRTIATTSGSVYDTWMKNCFKEAKPLVFDSFANAVLAFRGGRADAVMWDDTAVLGIAVDRRDAEAHDRHVPRRPVRHRHQAGQRRAEAVGRLTAQPHEEEGHLHPDPQEQRPTAAVRRVPGQCSSAEEQLRLQRRRPDDGVPVDEATTRGAAASAAAPSPQ